VILEPETAMPNTTHSYDTFLKEHLSDLEETRIYLEVAIEEYEQAGDKEAFLLALRDVAEAQGGLVNWLNEQT
jgi:DNA-binding phage protein